MNIYRNDNWDLGYVAARGEIDGMAAEESPAYLYVTWGDGTDSYEEHYTSPQASFELIHFFTPWSGTYDITVEIGTAGQGYQVCTLGTFSFTP